MRRPVAGRCVPHPEGDELEPRRGRRFTGAVHRCRLLDAVDLSEMTAPATGTALLILVGFVLPGFVAVLLKERLYEVRGEETTFDRLLTTVYYSLLVYLLPAATVGLFSAAGALDRPDLEQFFRGESPLWLTGLIAATVLLVLPTLAAATAWSWMNSDARRTLYARSDRLRGLSK
jgi:hypothetical protein